MTDTSYMYHNMAIWIGIGIRIDINKIFSSVLGIKSIRNSDIGPPLIIMITYVDRISIVEVLAKACDNNSLC